MLKVLLKRLHEPIYDSRVRKLAGYIAPHLREGDRVLDVGCGCGGLGRAILDDPACPPAVQVRGVEQRRRGHEPIEVQAFDGLHIPAAERAYDVVLLADVLHHVEDPERLVRECIRVSKRLLIIKDHAVRGVLARQRLALLDWAANAPYGVPCLYRYRTAAQWTEAFRRHRLVVEEERASMALYPFGLDLVFGGPLHCLAVLRIPGLLDEEGPPRL